MRYITTPHFRLINLAVVLAILAALVNAQVLDSPVLPAYKDHFLGAALFLAVVSFVLVKPPPDLGPLPIPALSLVQIRIVTGALLAACAFSLANYYLIDPGLFSPYKKQAMVAAFAVLAVFELLYFPTLREVSDKASTCDDRDA
jgi:hypothetical protein